MSKLIQLKSSLNKVLQLLEELKNELTPTPPKKYFYPIKDMNIHWTDKASRTGAWRGYDIRNDVLEVVYKKNDRGTVRETQFVEFENTNCATLEFEAMFPSGFSFDTEGDGTHLYPDGFPYIVGKFHGLGPQKPITGRGENTDDGWSVRIYWQKSLKTHNRSKHSPVYEHNPLKFDYTEGVNFGVNYYGQGRETLTSGVYVPSSWSEIKNNTWYKFSLRVLLNDTGSQNGEILFIVKQGGNIVTRLHVEDLELRQKDGDISRFLFSTFFGGSSSAFSPQKDNMKAYFKNFKIIL